VVGNAADQFNLLTPRYGTDAGSATVESFRVLDTPITPICSRPADP
jgi:flagellar hook-associated protein 1